MTGTEAIRQDVKTISLVSLAHGLSHFFQIATAVVFPLIKDDLMCRTPRWAARWRCTTW